MNPTVTELLLAEFKRFDEEMTAKYGTPLWLEAMALEVWHETMQTETFPHNAGETTQTK